MKSACALLVAMVMFAGCAGYGEASITIDGTVFAYADQGELTVTQVGGQDWDAFTFASQHEVQVTVAGVTTRLSETPTTIASGPMAVGQEASLCVVKGNYATVTVASGSGQATVDLKMGGC